MHYKKLWITSCILAAGLTMNLAGIVSAEDAQTGDLIFAQCENYINIRSEADENSEVVAKLYNDGAATVEETEDNGWYKITSGNATGYVKAEYFATGDTAQEIADKVAYNVAVVNAEALNIRTAPSEESDVIDVATQSTELEVVDTSGEWATVALGNDVYGFIHPDYCQYKTYYPTAVTLEEEAAREEAMRRAEEAKAQAAAQEAASSQADAESTASSDDDSYSEDATYDQGTAEADTGSDNGSYNEDTTYDDGTTDGDTTYDDGTTGGDTTYDDGTTGGDTTYDDGTTGGDTIYDDGTTGGDTTYDDGTTGGDTTYDDGTTGGDTTYDDGTTGGDTSYDDGSSTDTSDSSDSSTSDSSLGQQIANYAVQFVGNPYVYGGTSLTNGTDCSGFTQSVMANFGIYIARTAADQSYGGTSVSISDIQPGDLLFYSDGSGISHVALYIGGGQIVHAATESQGIIISNYNYDSPVCAARYW